MARTKLLAAAALTLLLPRAASADDGPVVRPTLVAQLRLLADFPQADGAVSPPAALELRRVRPGLRLNALGGRLTGAFVLNTSPASLELMDLWVEYQARSHVRVRVGQTKQPFTAYRLGSFADLRFVDWALVTRTFGGERQLGVEVHNRGEGGAWEYSVGLWNGVTLRSAHGRGVADLYGQPVVNASDLRAYVLPSALHPELTARGAWHRRGRVQWELGLSALVDLEPITQRDFRAAVAPEASMRAGVVRVDVTGYLGLSELTQQGGLGLTWGALAEVGVTLAQRVTLGARYAVVLRDAALVEDARRAVAQSQVATRRVGADEEHEVGGAVDLRLPGVPVSANADLSWLRTTTAGVHADGLRVRVQAQLAWQ